MDYELNIDKVNYLDDLTRIVYTKYYTDGSTLKGSVVFSTVTLRFVGSNIAEDTVLKVFEQLSLKGNI